MLNAPSHRPAMSRLAPLRTLTGLGQHPIHKPKTAPQATLTFGDNPEFQQMYDQLLHTPDFSTFSTDQLEAFYTYLRQYSLQRGLEQQYDDAQCAREMSDKVLAEVNRRAPQTVDGPDIANMAEHEKMEFEGRWNRQLQEYDEKSCSRREQLCARQADERAKFENLWMEEMPRKYRKPSTELLQLRKIEKALAVSGNFQKAKKVHGDVEQLAQIEMTNAQSLLIHDYEMAQKKLIQKHQQELELFETTRKHERSILLAQYDSQKVAIDHRELVVQVRTQNPRLAKNALATANAPLAYAARSRTGAENVLLPPLRAPNDPEMMKEQNRQKRDQERRKLAMQKKHAEDVLMKYSLDPQALTQRREGARTVRVTEANGVKVVDHVEEQPPEEAEVITEQPLGRICHSYIDAQSG
jgi:hypothetical protein